MMEPGELKPCPFCGNPNIEYDIICIECGNCGAGGGARRAIGEDGVLTSEELWNKRSDKALEAALLRISELEKALRTSWEAVADPVIGTYDQDDAVWYRKVEAAVAAISAVLSPLGG